MPASFQCTVVTPERKLLDAEVSYASVPAWDGQVGIAPQRAPLLAKLGYGELRLDLTDGQSQRYFVGGGFAQMKGNVLSILADEAAPVEELDRAAAERTLREQAGKIAPAGEAMDQRDRHAERARAILATLRH